MRVEIMTELQDITPSDHPSAPERFRVAVLLDHIPLSGNRWLDARWQAVGLVAGDGVPSRRERTTLVSEGGGTRYLVGGLELRLHPDEAESYHRNLTVGEPRCFVIARPDADGDPEPFLVTVSFDEAQAYQEGDDLVYSVPMPPEVYRWVEAYVVGNYVPEQRKKRTRQDWSKP
jgi:hypothetical protein